MKWKVKILVWKDDLFTDDISSTFTFTYYAHSFGDLYNRFQHAVKYLEDEINNYADRGV